jgi:glycosyltransferase involved in cell wall biosynthesis
VKAASVALPAAVEARLAELGQVELLVGIPSFNNARTIGHVVRAVEGGFAKYFPGSRALIVNSDGGSSDGTPAAVASAEGAAPGALLVSHPLSAVHRIVTPYHGIPGKGSAIRTVCAIA